MADNFDKHAVGLSGPASRGVAVTPNDGADLATVSRGISVAAAGDVHITTAGGTEITAYLVAGVIHPIRVSKVFSTGTTATGIVAWD